LNFKILLFYRNILLDYKLEENQKNIIIDNQDHFDQISVIFWSMEHGKKHSSILNSSFTETKEQDLEKRKKELIRMQWLNVLNNVYHYVSPFRSRINPRNVIEKAFIEEDEISLYLFMNTISIAAKYIQSFLFLNIQTIRYNSKFLCVINEEGNNLLLVLILFYLICVAFCIFILKKFVKLLMTNWEEESEPPNQEKEIKKKLTKKTHQRNLNRRQRLKY